MKRNNDFVVPDLFLFVLENLFGRRDLILASLHLCVEVIAVQSQLIHDRLLLLTKVFE